MSPRHEIEGSGVERIRDATDQACAQLQAVERAEVSHELFFMNFMVEKCFDRSAPYISLMRTANKSVSKLVASFN